MDIYELHCFYFIWLTSHNWALVILPGYLGDNICQYVLSYPATIGLAKREVSIARILAICKPRNSPYTISTVSQTGNMIGFKHVFWIA
jgi:hypothetical protein